MFGRKKPDATEVQVAAQPVQRTSFWKAVFQVMACGAGLFSDGYINNVSWQTTWNVAQVEMRVRL
jgi:hypothetical protein